METVRFAFVVHNHQPVGNFHEVIEAAYRDGYLPFIELLENYSFFRVSLHISGPLLEWLEKNHPEYIERLRNLVSWGQVEILGGAYYEPILSMIPTHDRLDQIRLYRRHLEELFDTSVHGMWLAERVWEPNFVQDLVRAGVNYTLLDDFHFKTAGLDDHQLTGYYVTEDNGYLLKVFPISEELRYYIPFRTPEETIALIRERGSVQPGALLVFGDDGEKFGVWPETRQHVYEQRWLPRFLELLRENADWLQPVTLSEAVRQLPPRGRVYLPDCSYREMTEWALPTERAVELRQLAREMADDPRWPKLRRYIRGASWRNFRIKYPESHEMYCRMLEVSRKVQEALTAVPAETTSLANATQDSTAEAARRELHRAQCNCAYWHGWFGGLYLPHLRHAVYEHLLRAEELAETARAGGLARASIETADFNLDGRVEVKLANEHMAAYVCPATGGCLYELDIKPAYFNALALVSRRPEPYHEGLAEKLASDPTASSLIRHGPDGRAELVYDSWRRAFAVDHVYPASATLSDLLTQRVQELLDNPLAAYPDVRIRRGDELECRLSRIARFDRGRLRIVKRFVLSATEPELSVSYEIEVLEDLPEACCLVPELALAAMAGHTPDRYLRLDSGTQTPCLNIPLEAESCGAISLHDDHLGLAVHLSFTHPAKIRTVPIETVSQSEAGSDRIFQGVILCPAWPLPTTAGGRFAVTIHLRSEVRATPSQPTAEASQAVTPQTS